MDSFGNMESFDINVGDLEPVNLKIDDYDSPAPSNSKSVNFGGGIELLMNNSKRSAGNSVNIDLGDINSLENELNDLSSGPPPAPTNSTQGESKMFSGIGNFFGLGGGDKETGTSSSSSGASNLGQATKETGAGTNKTWDGFMKFNDIPDRPVQPRMSDREKPR